MHESGKRNPERPYDLEQRTELFAREVRTFVQALPRSIANTEDAKQLVRSSGSVGANYIEANESLGRKDFLLFPFVSDFDIRISKFPAQPG